MQYIYVLVYLQGILPYAKLTFDIILQVFLVLSQPLWNQTLQQK